MYPTIHSNVDVVLNSSGSRERHTLHHYQSESLIMPHPCDCSSGSYRLLNILHWKWVHKDPTTWRGSYRVYTGNYNKIISRILSPIGVQHRVAKNSCVENSKMRKNAVNSRKMENNESQRMTQASREYFPLGQFNLNKAFLVFCVSVEIVHKTFII